MCIQNQIKFDCRCGLMQQAGTGHIGYICHDKSAVLQCKMKSLYELRSILGTYVCKCML